MQTNNRWVKIEYLPLDDLIDEKVGEEVLDSTVIRNYGHRDRNRSRWLQRKIIRLFLESMLEYILDHGVFEFYKRAMRIQIGTVKKPKTRQFDYMTGHTFATVYVRTSKRFYKKIHEVKPYLRLKKSIFKELQKKHREQKNYYVK